LLVYLRKGGAGATDMLQRVSEHSEHAVVDMAILDGYDMML